MEKVRKLELIQRSLGLRHKIKVMESMKSPDTHDELSHHLLSKWELEDEVRAIEQILADAREANISLKRAVIEREGTKPKKKKL